MNFRKEGTFFPWPDSKDGKEGVVLRVPDWSAFQEWKNIQDSKERHRKMMDFCIVSWSGVLDEQKQEIPCTAENKMALLFNNPSAAEFIHGCLDKLTKNQEEQYRKFKVPGRRSFPGKKFGVS